MKSYARQLILDFVSRDLSAVRPRSLVLPDEPRRIITVTGARRAGKTHLLLHHIHRLRKTVHPSRLIYINFENDRLFPFTLEKAQQIIETYYEVYPENKSEKVYFFFDEIQNIPEWHLFIRRLYDTENCYLFLTGSSSRLLSREIATSLRGRTITYELFPLSFPEFAGWSGLTTAPGYTSKQRAELVNACHRYMTSSAFPELFGEQEL
ncbi:MAG: AAA family ATPase, partial [Bacteroidales bacterium]|nr:AAA family ATPase [Bacteroidales bacterium]